MRKGKTRRDAQMRGQIEISKPVFEKFVKLHERFSYYKDEWEYRHGEDNIYIPVRRFMMPELKDLIKVMSGITPRPSSTISQLASHIDVIENPTKKGISSLILLETAITAYLRKNIIEGWIFVKHDKSGYLEPYLVSEVKYYPTVRQQNYVEPAHTVLSAKRWHKGSQNSVNFTWYDRDLGRSVELLLLDEGVIHESPRLVQEYYDHEKTFLAWRQLMGHQFIGNGYFKAKGSRDWDEKQHDSEMKNTRVIVDDRCDAIERHSQGGLFMDLGDDETDEATVDPEQAEKYTILPTTFYVWVFNLDSHREGWVHIWTIEPYVYNPRLREKLILPEAHQDLIDALTADMDVLLDDIVSGKSGGTAIMCQGKAGTGKTLTAEIYAEVVKRPLYRVHSGQLGIEAEQVENVLKEALTRSKRWGAILLIDEADVFVMKRGENLDLNAVCGVFLRLLEYYDGLIFMTTNRLDDIDDAILSRCIATIKFEPPKLDERQRLWKVLGDTYGLKLAKDKKSIDTLAKDYPTATGRDIKGLIRLAIKYGRQSKREPTLADIKRFAPYRGM